MKQFVFCLIKMCIFMHVIYLKSGFNTVYFHYNYYYIFFLASSPVLSPHNICFSSVMFSDMFAKPITVLFSLGLQ